VLKAVRKEARSGSEFWQEPRWLKMVSLLPDINLKTSVNAGNGGVASGH
jgi:hypothetical protein